MNIRNLMMLALIAAASAQAAEKAHVRKDSNGKKEDIKKEEQKKGEGALLGQTFDSDDDEKEGSKPADKTQFDKLHNLRAIKGAAKTLSQLEQYAANHRNRSQTLKYQQQLQRRNSALSLMKSSEKQPVEGQKS